MSDSESSEEIEVKVEQQHSAKFKELIEKAKEILPFYSEESLHQIYKQCFQTENVFLNKLNILAKQNLNSQGDDQEWIVEKKHLKQNNPRKFQFEQNGVQREKYNFLEDKLLIERASKYRRPSEKQREYPKKPYQQYRQKHNENQETPKQKTYFKSQKPNQFYQTKKVLYKEKEQAPEPTKTQNQPAPKPVVQQAPKIQAPVKKPNTQSNLKQETKPAPQKKQKYMEKKQTAKEPDVKPQQKVEPVQSQPKVEQKQPVVKPKQQAKNKQVPKPKQETKQPIQTKKQVEKAAVPAKIQPVIIQQQKKQKTPEQKTVPENVASNTSITSQGQQAKNQSTKKIERVKDPISPEVEKQFENSLSQNSFILSFIKPSSKLQQISYLRYSDGKIKQVKVKQPLNKKN